MTRAFARPLTDVSDAGLAAAIEADQIATRILAPEVPVEVHDDPDATWGIARYPDPFRSVVVSARFGEADADRPGGNTTGVTSFDPGQARSQIRILNRPSRDSPG